MQVAIVGWVAGALGIVLAGGLCRVWVLELRRTPRQAAVDWPVAILLETAVTTAATANLLLPGLLHSDAARQRISTPELTSAAVAVLGIASSVALLHQHRRHPTASADALFWRRAGVIAPGLLGYLALGWGASLTTGELPLSFLPVFAAPWLIALIGIVLLSRGIALLTAGSPPLAADEPTPDPTQPAPVPTKSVAEATDWTRYRRPLDE